MSNVTFKLNLSGLNQLMKSGAMQSVIQSGANAIASAAGDGYKVESAHPISFIAIARVSAATYKARLDCSKNNTLIKAAGGVRI